MLKLLLPLAILAIGPAVAAADEQPTEAEAALISAAVAAFGCEGGEYEKESEGSGVLEAEDVTCKTGQYDFRISPDGKTFAITAD